MPLLPPLPVALALAFAFALAVAVAFLALIPTGNPLFPSVFHLRECPALAARSAAWADQELFPSQRIPNRRVSNQPASKLDKRFGLLATFTFWIAEVVGDCSDP